MPPDERTVQVPHRVLHLDDSRLDAELIRDRIEGDEPHLWEFVHVEGREGFERAVSQPGWDLVLCDYNIPGYDGMSAVRLAHEKHPDVPIIVVSGSLSEEDAVDSLKAGATDYIFKQRLQRIGPAALRAIAEARERRKREAAEAEARQLAERLKMLAERSQDIFWMMSLAPLQITFVGPSIERVWGRPVEDFYADPHLWLQGVHPDDRERVGQAFEALTAGRAPRFDEQYRVVRPDGSVAWVHSAGTPVTDPKGVFHEVSGVARDVTERVETGRLLLDREKRFRAMFEQAAVGMAFLDLEGNPVRTNRRYAEILGYTPEELEPDMRVVHPDDEAAARQRRERLLSGEATATGGTKRYIRKDGSIVWCEVTNSLVRDAEDRPSHILTVIQDITDRVAAERRLRESEALFRSTVDAMVEGVTLQDAQNRIVAVNPSACTIVGMSRESLLGLSSRLASLPIFREDGSVMPPEERPSVKVMRTGRAQRGMVFGFRRPDGRMVWLSANAQPLMVQGEPGVLTTYHDITEARAAAEALRESGRRHRALVANLQGMVYRCKADPERTMEFVSEGCRGLLGIEPGELTSGRLRYADFIHPQDRQQVEAEIEQAEARRVAFTIEYRLHHSDGRRLHVVEKGSGVWDDSGTIVAREGFVSDITARVHAEEALRELNVSLERRVAARTGDLTAANRELEAFSYSVSHDLRAPLGAIRGFAEALHESVASRLDPQERHFLDRIRAGGERMDSLIEDMLSLSRISRADLAAIDMDLTSLVREVVDQLREQQPGRAARVHIHEGMRVHADPGLLRIALTNLVANAWKFSSGRAEVVVEIGEIAQEGLAQRFFVRDEGAGFDPAHSAKLFGTFQRLHSQSEFPGTGVGLATVRRVIERHGGNVWAEGAVGAGATFYFTLPRAAVPAVANP